MTELKFTRVLKRLPTDMDRPNASLQAPALLAATVALASLLMPAPLQAAGFEIPDNTAKSLARGGTGAVLTDDPSALYFNPALLSRADGLQIKLDVNVVDLDVRFERDPLVIGQGDGAPRKTFDPTSNQAGPFPVPFLAASWDLGTDNATIGIGIFGPPAYGFRCFGRLKNGNCEPDRDGAARHMMISSRLIQAYGSLGGSYRFDLDDGSHLSIGAAAMLAYQNNDFKLAINAAIPPTPPWQENPEDEAIFTARDLTGWNFTGMLGLAWEATNGLRLAASYRPPMHWESEGTAEVEFSDKLGEEGLGLGLSDQKVTFRTHQAGKLRLGFAYEGGENPRDAEQPRWNVEVNAVWEDWSRVDFFEIEPAGELTSSQLGEASLPKLHKIKQPKGYRDTISIRGGTSWTATEWLTLHGGAYLETPAQPNSYTNVDFVSWERYAGTLGTSFHPTEWMDIDLAYAHVFSPNRTVSDGQVYNQIPLSACRAPGYDQEACARPGQPPGNPQNNGRWTANVDMASAGVTLKFD